MNIERTIAPIIDSTLNTLYGRNAIEMQIDYSIVYEHKTILIYISTGFPCAFLEDKWTTHLKSEIAHLLPNEKIQITLEQKIKAHKTQMPGKSLKGIKNTIAVASGKGGVGKSTVTVNLSIALAKAGARVGILDADIYGPSIPLMLGTANPIEIKDDKYIPALQHGVQAMSIGYLMKDEQPLIWRGPMLAKSLIQMLDITYWDNLDYLLIDLPPGTGDIQLSLVQKIPLTGAIIVTTPQQVATIDAQKAIKMFETTGIDVLGIIENMALHTCSQCGHQEAVFNGKGAHSLCEQHQCAFLGQLPLDMRISAHCDEGIPTTAREYTPLSETFIQAALLASIELSKKQLNYADRFPPIVVE